MLDLQIMDSVALCHLVGKIKDIEGSLRIVRTRSALHNQIEAITHDRDAIHFGSARGLPPRSGRSGGDGRTDKKLSTFDHLIHNEIGEWVVESIR